MSIVSPEAPPTVEQTPISDRYVVQGRLGPAWLNHIRAWTGWPWEIRLARAALMVPRIRSWEKKYLALTTNEMKECGLHLRGRARGGEKLDRLLPEAFGLVSVAVQRLMKL